MLVLGVVKTLEAQYENGILRPVEKLSLRPGERVNIIVLRRPDRGRWDFVRLARLHEDDASLAAQGLGEWTTALDLEDRH